MPKTIILMGKSGAGKGTQAGQLRELLKDSGDMLYVETGQKFREYIKSKTHSSSLSEKVMNSGEKQPEFLAVAMWGNFFLEKIKTGKEHIIIDGAPRALAEAMILDTAMKFYDREKVYIFVLGVPDKIVTRRMLKRGRKDDNPKDIATRLKWFKEDVLPAILFFRSQKERYIFHVIKAGRTPIEVHHEILSKLSIG